MRTLKALVVGTAVIGGLNVFYTAYLGNRISSLEHTLLDAMEHRNVDSPSPQHVTSPVKAPPKSNDPKVMGDNGTYKVADYHTFTPKSYVADNNSPHQMSLDLEVVKESKIECDPKIKPPLRGTTYFCRTPDNYGYVVFTSSSSLKVGDKFSGWFSETQIVDHPIDGKDWFPIITPVIIEQMKPVDEDSVYVLP